MTLILHLCNEYTFHFVAPGLFSLSVTSYLLFQLTLLCFFDIDKA
jgi:hypothetical protein